MNRLLQRFVVDTNAPRSSSGSDSQAAGAVPPQSNGAVDWANQRATEQPRRQLDEIPLSSRSDGTTYEEVDLFDDSKKPPVPKPAEPTQAPAAAPAQEAPQQHAHTQEFYAQDYAQYGQGDATPQHGDQAYYEQYGEYAGNYNQQYDQQQYDQQQQYYDQYYSQQQYYDQQQYSADPYQYYNHSEQPSSQHGTDATYAQDYYAQQSAETTTTTATADSFFSGHEPTVSGGPFDQAAPADPSSTNPFEQPASVKPAATAADAFAHPPAAVQEQTGSAADYFQQTQTMVSPPPPPPIQTSSPVQVQDFFGSNPATAAPGSSLFGDAPASPSNSASALFTTRAVSVAGSDHFSASPISSTTKASSDGYSSPTTSTDGGQPAPMMTTTTTTSSEAASVAAPTPTVVTTTARTTTVSPRQGEPAIQPQKVPRTAATATTTTTLDDSIRLMEMYKTMAERLEKEKSELLKVLADQAEQFYQMQDYIASLERELNEYRAKEMHGDGH